MCSIANWDAPNEKFAHFLCYKMTKMKAISTAVLHHLICLAWILVLTISKTAVLQYTYITLHIFDINWTTSSFGYGKTPS